MYNKKLGGSTVLVTGSSGFIGSHLCARLIATLGCKVMGIDSVPTKHNPVESKIPSNTSNNGTSELFSFRQVDISNGEEIHDFYKKNNFDFVFHLAALANPRTCNTNFDLAFKVNVLGTKNIIEESEKDSRIVFMSSAAVYGSPQKVPILEGHPLDGNDTYAITKIMGEDLCRCFLKNYDRNIVIGRNFNTFGDGQVADYIIPTLIKQALTEHMIEIWSTTPIRDFLYVEDTLDALTIIAEHGERGHTYNIGSGKGIRIGELAGTIRDIVDEHIMIRDLKKQVLGSTNLVAENSKLCSLGWTAKFEFHEGLRRTIDWFKAADQVVIN